MNKEYIGYTKEQRFSSALVRFHSTLDKRGIRRWYSFLQGFGARRIDEHYAKTKLREYGLALDEFIAFQNEWNAKSRR